MLQGYVRIVDDNELTVPIDVDGTEIDLMADL